MMILSNELSFELSRLRRDLKTQFQIPNALSAKIDGGFSKQMAEACSRPLLLGSSARTHEVSGGQPLQFLPLSIHAGIVALSGSTTLRC